MGAEAGAEIGSLGGLPGMLVGALVGAIVGGVIGYGAGIALSKALQNANTKADTSLSPSDTSQPCADCGDGPDCFEPPDGADPEEFARQLQMQEDEINELSPDDMLQRLADGDARKAATNSYRGSRDAELRQAERDKVSGRAFDDAYESALQSGESSGTAKRIADEAAQAALKGQDALHVLDWVAGGDGTISGLGDSSVNRSIGSQWAKAKRGSALSRRDQLREAAKKAKAEGKEKMDVSLEEC